LRTPLFFLIVSLAFCCGAAHGPKTTSGGKLVGDVADKAENAQISKALLFVRGPDNQKDVIVKITDDLLPVARQRAFLLQELPQSNLLCKTPNQK
jgi:hypothetical protein